MTGQSKLKKPQEELLKIELLKILSELCLQVLG